MSGELMIGKYLTTFQHKLLLKKFESNELSAEYRQRIKIMLLADAGRSQTQICEALGCAQETARYWMSMAQAGQAHKWNERPVGRPKKIDDKYLQRLRELVSQSPKTFGYTFERWTGQWLSKQLAKELDVQISSCHVNRLLKHMNLSTRANKGKSTLLKDSPNATLSIKNLSSKEIPEATNPYHSSSTG